MPRKIKGLDIEAARANNLKEHIQRHEVALSYPPDRRVLIADQVHHFPTELSVTGRNIHEPVTCDPDLFVEYMRLAATTGIDIDLLCPFYWSAAGWEGFLTLWKSCTQAVYNMAVVHIPYEKIVLDWPQA
jgi:hypothetical protein